MYMTLMNFKFHSMYVKRTLLQLWLQGSLYENTNEKGELARALSLGLGLEIL